LRASRGCKDLVYPGSNTERSPKTLVVKTNERRGGFTKTATRGGILVATVLRKSERRTNGKAHLDWSVVENKRLGDGRAIQRPQLDLGEIASSQAEAWRKAIAAFDADGRRSRAPALFPEDRRRRAAADDVIRLRFLGDAALSSAAVGRAPARRRPVARTATRPRLGRTPAAKPQRNALGRRAARVGDGSADRALAANGGCIAKGSSTAPWPICRDRISARPRRTSSPPATISASPANRRCSRNRIERGRDPFDASFDVLLYDLASTDFAVDASDLPEGSKRRHGRQPRQAARKGDLAIRPIFHHDERRIEAHIFLAFLAYRLQVALTRRLNGLAPGLAARKRASQSSPPCR